MATVTWIGLGQMGRPMAANLLAAGHTVRGIEIDPAAAAEAADAGIPVFTDLRSAVDGSDFVFTMLPNGGLVEDVLTRPDGVFSLVGPSTVVVDSSTIDVTTARRLHEVAKAAGHRFLDAPVSGGVNGAVAGSLTIMVGGEASVAEAATDVLHAMGTYVVHVGSDGAGQAAKIVNNMVFGICLAATCEGVALAERLGLDTKVLYEIVTRSSGDNWALRTWYPVPGVVDTAPSNGGFAPGFTTTLLVKDLGLALGEGEATGSPLATAATAYRLFSEHMAHGGARLDCTSLVQALSGRDPKVTVPAGGVR
jgi:3-hydroxyisobutyrate dehydrogenase